MTFIINISKENRKPLSDGVLRVLAEHTARKTPAKVLSGRFFSAAIVGSVKINTYKDGITVLIIGKPNITTTTIPGSSVLDIIHALYKNDGEGFIGKVRGGFGIIIIDNNKEKVIAFRDRIGFYPIFYSINSTGLWLSNSVKPILASRSVSFSLDHQAIYRYLFLKAFESPDTPINEIRSLKPGCSLLFTDKSINIKQYWDIPLPTVQKDSAKDAEKKDKLIGLLKTVLGEQSSYSGSQSGLLLSGGIDSSILAALSSNNNKGKSPIAFNVNFSGRWKHLDESKYAELVAQSSSIQLQKVDFNINSLLGILPILFWNNNLPTANSGFKLALIAEKGFLQDIDSYILGEGADTLLDYLWKWKYFNLLYRAAFLTKIIPDSAKTFILRIIEEFLYMLETKFIGRENWVEILRSYLALHLGYWKWKGSRIRINELTRLFSSECRDKLGGGLIRRTFSNHYKKVDSKEFAEKLIYATLKSYTPNQQLMNYQTICNYYGADMFCPYLDERIIEYCLKLPVDIRAGKKILKSIANKFVPHEVINREKRVFIVPMEIWLRNQLRSFVDVVFSEENIKKRGIFDIREMIKLKESFYSDKFQSWSDIWSFVLLEAWLRINYDAVYPQKPESIFDIFPEVKIPDDIQD